MSYRKNGYKDIDKWRKTVTRYNREYYRKTAIYDRRKWTQEEIDEIMNREIPDMELSKKLQRSMKSIALKRCRINKKLKEK